MNVLKFILAATVAICIMSSVVLYRSDIPKDVVDAKYTSTTSQFLNLKDQGVVHFRDEGNRHGLAVVLLHGSNASLHTFEPWVRYLKEVYRVITIDLPGHGLTGAVPAADYSANAFIEVIREVMARLDVSRFVIGGNSKGGSTAWRYTLAYPEQIVGLILIDAGGPYSWRDERDPTGTPLAFRLLDQGWFRAIGKKIDPYYLVVEGIETAYGNPDLITEPLIMRYYDLNLREGTRGAIFSRFAQRADNADENLSEIVVPTLVMWGEADSLISLQYAKRFEAAIPDTTTAYYQGVGHMPMEENPTESAKDLLHFLERFPNEN